MKQLTHYDIQNEQQQFPITIVCDAIRTPENIGMCFRIADSFGVSSIYLHENSPSIENRIVKKTARNTINQITHTTYADFEGLIQTLKSEGNSIIGIEITDESIDIQDFDFKNHEKILPMTSKVLRMNFYDDAWKGTNCAKWNFVGWKKTTET